MPIRKRLLHRHEAYDVLRGRRDAPILLTCEHASQRMPTGYGWPDADRRLLDTHWAYDLGAAEITRDLSHALEAVAILARFTRLLIDPNRPENSETLFRSHAEGLPVLLNSPKEEEDGHLDGGERERRIRELSRPYHDELHKQVAAGSAGALVAMHTFTPVYEGERRRLEVGVLFDQDENQELAESLTQHLKSEGYESALNAPYSGKRGMMYSVDRHAREHGRKAIEFEIRQDIAGAPSHRARLVGSLKTFFRPQS